MFVVGTYERKLIAVPSETIKHLEYTPREGARPASVFVRLLDGGNWKFEGDEAEAIWKGVLAHGVGKAAP